jgi:hypothetical protein
VGSAYGYQQGTPIPAGGSRVTIRLEPAGDTTRLHLTHEFTDAGARDHHVQGWRYQLSLFANAVADEVFGGVNTAVDTWFDAWSDPKAHARDAALTRVASPHVRFCDTFSVIEGIAELIAQVAGYHQFMPGVRFTRDGEIRRCQGTVLADWVAHAADGAERGRGTNVFTFGGDGRVESVVGFWQPPRTRAVGDSAADTAR